MRLIILLILIFSYCVKAQVGINTNSPRTTFDVNGTVANYEQSEEITSLNLTINSLEQSQLSLTGTTSGNFKVTLPDGVPGQRLVIVNNENNGNDAIIGMYSIPNGQAIEMVYSNNSWKSIRSGDKTNVNIYGTTLPILPHSSEVSGVQYTNKTQNVGSTDIISPGGDGMWHIVKQTNLRASFRTNGSNQGTFNSSRKEIEYEYDGYPFNIDNVYPIVTAGNNSSYNDVFSANVISFLTINGKTRLKISIIRADYLSNNSALKVDGYDASTSDWQGSFYVNILLATKFFDF